MEEINSTLTLSGTTDKEKSWIRKTGNKDRQIFHASLAVPVSTTTSSEMQLYPGQDGGVSGVYPGNTGCEAEIHPRQQSSGDHRGGMKHQHRMGPGTLEL